MLARWRSRPIRYRVQRRQPITERLESISLNNPPKNNLFEKRSTMVNHRRFTLGYKTVSQIQTDGMLTSRDELLKGAMMRRTKRAYQLAQLSFHIGALNRGSLQGPGFENAL